MDISKITSLFTTSTRGENDSANKDRELVIEFISNNPLEYQMYCQDEKYGKSWFNFGEKWNNVVIAISKKYNIKYTTFRYIKRGGRHYHYDGDLQFYNDTLMVFTKPIEYKKGSSTICGLPQVLSLPAKYQLFPETCPSYAYYYYNNSIDRYLEKDTSIDIKKPELSEYLKLVKSNEISNPGKKKSHPFFVQLKERDNPTSFKREKDLVVHTSISDYLTIYGQLIDIDAFSEKLKSSQENKLYVLWNNENFHLDEFCPKEFENITYHGIKNGNIIQLKTGNTIYDLLLRWRNRQGVLNPAWQISVKRTK